MQDLWSTTKKTLLIVLALIFAGYILSQFLDRQTVTGVIAATALVSFIIQYRRTDQIDTESTGLGNGDDNTTDDTPADTPTDSSGPDVEPQSQAYSFSDTADTDDTREPLNRTGLRRSNDEILEEAGNKLRDQIGIYDDGTIELDGDHLDLYRKLMLYVVAKRMAYEDRFIDTPEVTINDINDRPDLTYNKIELLLFLREARDWLVLPNDQDPAVSTIDYADLDDAAFTVKTRSLSKITDWILEDPLPTTTPFAISYRLSNAAMALSEARNQYDKTREDEAETNRYSAEKRYDSVRQKILRACKDAAHYPIIFKRDHAWEEFTEYAEALLDFFEDDLYTKTEHCLPRMQRYRKQMEKTADDASAH